MRAVVLFFLRLLAQASADDTTCVSPCAMTTEAAQAALERQRARSAQLVAEIRPQRMRDAREKARAQEKANRGVKGEFNDNFVASKVLGWAVTAPGSSAGDILEIGASNGAGTTGILARALQESIASGTSATDRRLLSMEVRAEKFVLGEELRKANGWASSIILASSIAESEFPDTHDATRPDSAGWLQREKKSAQIHGAGSLGPLCVSKRYALMNVDGGAFTGHAEWRIIQTLCGRIRWVALDDTDFKTKIMLDYARNHPDEWEVVYEESVDQTLLKGGRLWQGVQKKQKGTRQAYGEHKAVLDALVKSHLQHGKLHLYRNFALIRKRNPGD